ncbi:MAG TPA: TraB/GumN family protein [Burkholderiaceae bacterium]|nr:TraB/GumN family protein [Burkholderiaceae bacterium]
MVLNRMGFQRKASLALVWLALWAALAQSVAWAGSGQDGPRGFVWEATRGAQRVILVGTVHVGRADFVGLPAAIERRAQQAAVIVVEADVSNAQAAAEATQRYALYGPGEAALDERLSADLWRRLKALLPRYGMNPAVVGRMKPWFVAMNLTLAELARLGLSPAQGTERYLFALAAQTGKPVVEMEGMLAQLKLLDSALPSEQAAFLEQAISAIEQNETQREAQTIMQAWAQADAPAMERLLAKLRARAQTNAADRFMFDQVLEGRNPGMLRAIERYGASGRLHLVAVGSLHYFGPNGIVDGLRKRGWTVTQVAHQSPRAPR